jgi:hypothetical protein
MLKVELVAKLVLFVNPANEIGIKIKSATKAKLSPIETKIIFR